MQDAAPRVRRGDLYRGGAPTITALIAGEIPLAFETMLALGPHVRADTARAITSPKRSALINAQQ